MDITTTMTPLANWRKSDAETYERSRLRMKEADSQHL